MKKRISHTFAKAELLLLEATVKSENTGASVSIINGVTARRLLSFIAVSVTLIVQPECVHSPSAAKLIVFDPALAEVVALVQSPP